MRAKGESIGPPPVQGGGVQARGTYRLISCTPGGISGVHPAWETITPPGIGSGWRRRAVSTMALWHYGTMGHRPLPFAADIGLLAVERWSRRVKRKFPDLWARCGVIGRAAAPRSNSGSWVCRSRMWVQVKNVGAGVHCEQGSGVWERMDCQGKDAVVVSGFVSGCT